MRIHAIVLKVLLALLLLLPAGLARAAENSIAVVIAAEGGVYARRGGESVPLALKGDLYESDMVLTGPGGKLQMLFNDDSTVTVGPDSMLELREFADNGKESRFNAHLEGGNMRIITGRLTESNPAGFEITTPLATIGIRGTILNVESSENHTSVKVLNTDRSVLVNNTEVKEGFKIDINREGVQQVSPLDSKEREAANRELAVGAGVATGGLGVPVAQLEGASQTASSLLADLAEHPQTIFALSPAPAPAGPLIATVAGTLSITLPDMVLSGSGSFSFDIDLSTSQASNAQMSGSWTGSPTLRYNTLDFNGTGGTGFYSLVTGTDYGYTLSGFTGTITSSSSNANYDTGGASHTIASSSTALIILDGGGNTFANVGDPVGSGSKFIVTDGTTNTVMVDGEASGSRVL